MVYPPGKVIPIYSILLQLNIFFMHIMQIILVKHRILKKTSEILTVSSGFDICSFVQISRNLGGFLQVETCAIFWKISHLHLRNFSIVCIILSSAHKKIIFFLSVPGVLKWMHPKMSKTVALL